MDRAMKACCRLVPLLAATLAACGTASAPTSYVKTQTVGPSGATITVSASEDETLAGTSITIPAGALSTSVAITIEPSTQAVNPAGTTAAGPVVEFLPDGTKFSQPVTITIPITLANATARNTAIEAVESDGSSKSIEIESLSGGVATFLTSGFTRFGGYWASNDAGDACAANSDCPSGEACVNGACAAPTTTTDAGQPDAGQPDAGLVCRTDADCGPGSVCQNGQCASAGDGGATCATGLTQCGGSCTNTQSDPNNCGACDAVCPSGDACGGGVCTSPNGDLDGGAECQWDADCASGAVCVNGQCTPAGDGGQTCPAGLIQCGGWCTNTQTDPSNCGACEAVCPTGDSCESGACTQGGGPDAGSDAGFLCLTDADCGPGSVCVNGQCASSSADAGQPDSGSCAAGLTQCSGCTDTQSDPDNCGACGEECGSGNTCNDGVCTGGGSDGGAYCETNADCASGQSCVNGVCSSPSDAGAACRTNADCPNGQACYAGQCS